jgi:hypothetical protein
VRLITEMTLDQVFCFYNSPSPHYSRLRHSTHVPPFHNPEHATHCHTPCLQVHSFVSDRHVAGQVVTNCVLSPLSSENPPLPTSCPSVCQRVTQRLPLKRFSGYSILETSTQNYREIKNWIEIEQGKSVTGLTGLEGG